MKVNERNMRIDLNKRWLSDDNRLLRWNHLRDRCGLEPLTLEQAAELMTVNKPVDRAIREYLEGR